MKLTTLRLDIDHDGVALVTLDVPGSSTNLVNPALIDDLNTVVTRLRTDSGIIGAVITSAKPAGFMAGADLNAILEAISDGPTDKRSIFETIFKYSAALRALETCGKPVAAAINGTALGGGLELPLACHYRVTNDNPRTHLGFPEVMVGLLPGAGGTQRLPRLIGAQTALLYLTQGKLLSPTEALNLKIVDDVVRPGDEIMRATIWVKENPNSGVAPWDTKGFKVLGGAGATNPAFAQTFAGANAIVHGRTLGLMSAPQAILSCVYEGLQLPIDTALRVEAKYMTALLSDAQATNMIRTLFISKQAAEKGARRPAEIAAMPTRKLAILGAGMMGIGVAAVSARSGIDVVMLDRDQATADNGKQQIKDALSQSKSVSPAAQEEILARVHATASFDDILGCDFVIEAVFEDRAVKAETTRKALAVVGPGTIFGSNTSTLPITSLAEAWDRPENFIGVHFFSPVEKMPLVEIIVGRRTGPMALAKALDFVRTIRKTPIVVNDSRGFYTSRCFGTYVLEGVTLLGEGVNPALIENGGRQIGMAVGPLAVSDEVSIELGWHVMQAARADMGDAYRPTVADAVVEKMISSRRFGRKAGRGYYDYPENGKKLLWPGLAQTFPRSALQPTVQEVKERLLYRQLVECARCYDEGVLSTPEDGDLGAILGWGFAPHTGGPFSYIDTVGAIQVVETLDRLADAHGDRFEAPMLLRDFAAKDRRFYAPHRKKA